MIIKIKKTNSGFTLIELLVVIVIIGLLTGILLVNYNSVRQRGRDAKRKSDLQQVASALEIYKADYGSYPIGSGGVITCEGGGPCSWGSAFTCDSTIYMSKLPQDPLSDYSYSYSSAGASYTLVACLENIADPDKVPVQTCASGVGYQVINP